MASFSTCDSKTIFFFFGLRAAWLSLCLVGSVAELQRFEHPPKAEGCLSFLVVGDWGRRGLYNQSQVALQVSTYHFSQSHDLCT